MELCTTVEERSRRFEVLNHGESGGGFERNDGPAGLDGGEKGREDGEETSAGFSLEGGLGNAPLRLGVQGDNADDWGREGAGRFRVGDDGDDRGGEGTPGFGIGDGRLSPDERDGVAAQAKAFERAPWPYVLGGAAEERLEDSGATFGARGEGGWESGGDGGEGDEGDEDEEGEGEEREGRGGVARHRWHGEMRVCCRLAGWGRRGTKRWALVGVEARAGPGAGESGAVGGAGMEKEERSESSIAGHLKRSDRVRMDKERWQTQPSGT